MLRHEQQSIQMALATVMRHSFKVHTEYGAVRGLKTATRAGEEGHEDKHDAPRRQKPPPPQPELFQLYEETARREAADRSGRAAGTTGAGSEAHHGAVWRTCSHGADLRCSCAADGGPGGRSLQALRHRGARAGYRSAQDHSRGHPDASPGPWGAAGGTVGGRARAGRHPGTWQVRSWRQMVPDRYAGREVLLVDGWHSPCSVAPPGGIHRQPRAVFKYWAGAEAVAVVDDPVVTQHKFQQSFVDLFNLPQLQFIDRVLVFPVMPQSLVRRVQTVQKVGDSTAQFLGEAVDTPFVFQRQVPGLFQPVLKTVEVPQLQYFQGGRCPCCCSSSTRCGRPLRFAATLSRSGRCHRFSSSPNLVDIPVCTETGFAVGCDDGLFRRILLHFSRSSGCPGVERHFQQLGSPR